LYLINSPVVRGETLRFQKEGVRDVLKDVFLPWFNAFRFLIQNIQQRKMEKGIHFSCDPSQPLSPSNTMDKWILSFTQSLVKFVHKEMEAYHLYTVVPRLVKYINQLTNWYVRFNRRRIKGELGAQDCDDSMHTLFDVLLTMVKMMAPFTPFLTENMYQYLKEYLTGERTEETASVHYLMCPHPKEYLIDVAIERSVARMQSVIELVRVLRDRKVLPTKYPLPTVVVIHKDQQVLDDVNSLKSYILEELNVRELKVASNEKEYGVSLKAEADSTRLGKRLKGDFMKVSEKVKKLSEEEIRVFNDKGEMVVEGHALTKEDIKIFYSVEPGSTGNFEANADRELLVLLDCTPSAEMIEEGIAREVVNKIQRLRKKVGLKPTDLVDVFYETVKSDKGSDQAVRELDDIISRQVDYVTSSIKLPFKRKQGEFPTRIIGNDNQKIKGKSGASISLWLCAPEGDPLPVAQSPQGSTQQVMTTSISVVPPTKASGEIPACGFINVELLPGMENGLKNPYLVPFITTVLLENPKGEHPITYSQLLKEVEILLKKQNSNLFLYRSDGVRVNSDSNLQSLTTQTVYATSEDLGSFLTLGTHTPPRGTPVCAYVDVVSNGRSVTVLKENPAGCPLQVVENVDRFIAQFISR
jgi:isoleucyl-tRNA synthetase